MPALNSVTDYLSIDLLYPGFHGAESFESLATFHPQFFDKKEIHFYLFKTKVETYLKNGVEKTLLEQVTDLAGIKDATDHTDTEHAYYR